jgi:hypothetical protein
MTARAFVLLRYSALALSLLQSAVSRFFEEIEDDSARMKVVSVLRSDSALLASSRETSYWH